MSNDGGLRCPNDPAHELDLATLLCTVCHIPPIAPGSTPADARYYLNTFAEDEEEVGD